MRMTLWILAALVASCSAASAQADRPASQTPSYKHAYYLFAGPPANACEVCYVPLLLTLTPLEDLAHVTQGERWLLITTYERDSIWKIERIQPVARADVKPPQRHIRWNNRNYRYQEIGAWEVMRLVEDPDGTIAIHRTLQFGTQLRDVKDEVVASFGGRP